MLTVGTCGSYTGDTYIRLFKNGVEQASNNDACGLGSELTVVSNGSTYAIRVGCFGSGSCSGNLNTKIQ